VGAHTDGVIRLSDEARQLIAFFEKESGATIRDCVLEDSASRSDADGSSGEQSDPRDDRVVFVVAPGEMADAIGPQGRTVSRVEERVGTRVELVEDADDPGTFVANALRPAAVYDVQVVERDGEGGTETVAYAEVNAADFGAAIGSGGQNIRMAERLAARHVGVDAVELVPEPDSVLETVAEHAGVEPADALFDPADERLVVLVPTGTRGQVRDAERTLRGELGWPLVVVEYAGDAATLVENALAPAEVTGVTVSATGVAYVEVADDERGLAIGAGGTRIRLARLLAAEYFGLDDVELA
jgi:N utilization substance protein A